MSTAAVHPSPSISPFATPLQMALVRFDPRTETEETNDWIAFLEKMPEPGVMPTMYTGQLSGDAGSKWPGVGGTPPLIIEASSFVFK